MKKGIVAYIVTAVFVVANFFVLLTPDMLSGKNNSANTLNMKKLVCSGVGCNDGTRDCGTVSTTLKLDVKGYGGLEVSVEYQCYEKDYND